MNKGQKIVNKGFSLVELIVVIAIMAILIGVVAPQLIKYVEKSKVSSDIQMADTLHTAITYALMDPDVIADTSADNVKLMDEFTTPNNSFRLDRYTGPWLTTTFAVSVTEIVGWDPFDINYDSGVHFKSSHGSGPGIIPCAVVDESGNSFAIYLAWTDRTGKKQAENFNGAYDELEDSKVIFVK